MRIEVIKNIETQENNTDTGILENKEKQNESKEDLNLEQLIKDREEVEKKEDELKKILESIELDILNLEKQIPKVNGISLDREYEHFTDGLGENFKKKLDVLVSIQKDMANDFVSCNLEGRDKENLSNSITSMQSLVGQLRGIETGNENYDNQQFIRLTRSAFDIMINAYKSLNYIKKYNGYIDKYLDEKNSLNQYIAKIDNDPNNIAIKKQMYELNQVYQEKYKEKQSIQIERSKINNKIKDLENK